MLYGTAIREPTPPNMSSANLENLRLLHKPEFRYHVHSPCPEPHQFYPNLSPNFLNVGSPS